MPPTTLHAYNACRVLHHLKLMLRVVFLNYRH